MAASRLTTRPGDARSATLFLGRGPPKLAYSRPFHTPTQNTCGGGPTLPYPPTPLTLSGPKPNYEQLTLHGPLGEVLLAPPNLGPWASDP